MKEENKSSSPARIRMLQKQFQDFLASGHAIDNARFRGDLAKSQTFENEALQQFGVIWGYYVLLDRQEHRIRFLISEESKADLQVTGGKYFRSIPLNLPGFREEQIEQIRQKLDISVRSDPHQTFLNGKVSSPKVYHHLPPFQFVLNDLIKDTFIQVQMEATVQGFTVVLSEEILFYLCQKYLIQDQNDVWSLLHLEKTITIAGKKVYPHLFQLLKFAMSLEAQSQGTHRLHLFLGIDSKWGITPGAGEGSKVEAKLRRQIDESLLVRIPIGTTKDVENWFIEHLLPILKMIGKQLLKTIRARIFDDPPMSDMELLEFAARFNMETSEILLQENPDHNMHDFFVYPMVENHQDPYETENLPTFDLIDGKKATEVIKHPFLFCSYVETLYVLTQKSDEEIQLDEDGDSIEGFRITHLLCEHITKPMVESVYYGKIIDAQKRIESVRSAIAAIMARNLSHTDASHVMLAFEKYFLNQLNDHILYNPESSLATDFKSYNNYLINTVEFVADVSGGMGNQSKFSYSFDDISKRISNMFGPNFLGMGLVDSDNDNTFAQLTYAPSPDIEISLPGGENGLYALITILKNVVRNQYKHSDATTNGIYTTHWEIIAPEITELKDFLYQINLYDDSVASVADTKLEATVSKIDEMIGKPIVSDDGIVRSEGWGILEMVISSAYLIGFPLEKYDGIAHSADLVTIDAKLFPSRVIKVSKRMNPHTRQVAICYSFYVIKPKFCLIHCSNCHAKEKPNCAKIDLEKLRAHGVHVIPNDRPLLSQENYQFLVDPSKTTGTKYCNFRLIPQCSGLPSISDADGFMKSMGDFWVQTYFPHSNGMNIIKDESDFAKISMIVESALAIFDYHGTTPFPKLFPEGDGSTEIAIFKNASFDDLKNRFAYYEVYGSQSKIDAQLAKLNPWELKEAILTRIAVIDERIQADLETYDANLSKMTQRELCYLKGIFVPRKGSDSNQFHPEEFDIAKIAYDQHDHLKLSSAIRYYFEVKQCHYVVVHLSIMEAAVKDSDLTFLDFYNILLGDCVACENGRQLIITSGKGTPKTIPPGSFFVNLNTLRQAFMAKSKFELVALVNSVRSIQNTILL